VHIYNLFIIVILLFLSRFAIFVSRAILFFAISILSINAISNFFKEEEFFRCDKSMFDLTLLYKKDTRITIFCFLDYKRKHYLMRKIILNKNFFFFLNFIISL